MTVLEPFSLSCSCLMLPQSLAPFVCLFSYWQSSFCKDHWFDFWFKIFFLCKFHGPFFWFWNSNIFLSGGTFRKSSSILFKTRFAVSASGMCSRGCFLFFVFFVFKKKKHNILSWNCNIFLSGRNVRKSSSILFKTRSWVVEFLENILAFSLKQYFLYSHQSLVKEWLFFVFLIKTEVFVAEENSGLHERIIFMNLFQF